MSLNYIFPLQLLWYLKIDYLIKKTLNPQFLKFIGKYKLNWGTELFNMV